MTDLQAWAALLALGAFHGINPGMGWLFAVALGLQERRRRAVFRALLPIALGHALSIGVVVLVVGLAQEAIPLEWLRWPIGAGLVSFGGYKLFRMKHPKWVGMKVSFRDLVTWSFLMASAHGAGLMLVPVLLGWSAGEGGHEMSGHAGHDMSGHAGHDMSGHAGHDMSGGEHAEHASVIAAVGKGPWLALLATGVHTLGYLVVMLVCAVVVYEWVGLAILRKAWLNLDGVWAGALVLTGIATMLL
ncbi:hypothetical protein [Paraliomyxa miuraensis]|uniref:hypothetical protein n=1 Tax=Paraliomyxa miuraensis TaxID=376150 RepID=UPI002257D020|nr:hypothetical protein [Paraliomyxa miuraensis]MCX4239285.1 hypothetical protein [Paraliomyxa miuraensis]